ncbi:MAG: PAS domain-containing protein [Candidatus Didemnitutus sp.]|nr:PAS domain-containing protein [Candidatus Didemnitutus sp.]
MKKSRPQPVRAKPARLPHRKPAKVDELAELRGRLAEATETLRAIRGGEVDTVVVASKQGPQVFTLEGAEHAYRVLIESMNEGALTLTSDAVILYANQCFAQMVRRPLAQVIGISFRHFLFADDRARLKPLLKQSAASGAKLSVLLKISDDSQMPVQLSLRPMAREKSESTIFGLVVTDMTEARRSEEQLRALAHRVVQVQEAERSSVALDLHDHITQPLIAVLFSSQALANKLSQHDGPAKREAVKLRTLLGRTADEVERIARNLRPSILDQLGLFAMLRVTCNEFATRTGLAVKLEGAPLVVRLPADAELALYRIAQEALKNIEKHAHAKHVTVSLRPAGAYVQLVINDDGIGFDEKHHAARRSDQGILGLAGMRERAAYVGATLTVKSGRRAGTEIEVRIPHPTGTTTAAQSAA